MAKYTGPRYHVRVLNPRNWWKRFVSGDTDCERALLVALANAAKDMRVLILVVSGRRTLKEQAHLYWLYLTKKGNLAAKPNKRAPHIRGVAADCYIDSGAFDGQPIGHHPRWLSAAERRGLELPVHGEAWHVQRKGT